MSQGPQGEGVRVFVTRYCHEQIDLPGSYGGV